MTGNDRGRPAGNGTASNLSNVNHSLRPFDVDCPHCGARRHRPCLVPALRFRIEHRPSHAHPSREQAAGGEAA